MPPEGRRRREHLDEDGMDDGTGTKERPRDRATPPPRSEREGSLAAQSLRTGRYNAVNFRLEESATVSEAIRKYHEHQARSLAVIIDTAAGTGACLWVN